MSKSVCDLSVVSFKSTKSRPSSSSNVGGPTIKLLGEAYLRKHNIGAWNEVMQEAEGCYSMDFTINDLSFVEGDELLSDAEVIRRIVRFQAHVRRKVAGVRMQGIRLIHSHNKWVLYRAVLHLQSKYRGYVARRQMVDFVMAGTKIKAFWVKRIALRRTKCELRRVKRPIEIKFDFLKSIPMKHFHSPGVKIQVSVWTFPLLHILEGVDVVTAVKSKSPQIVWTSEEFPIQETTGVESPPGERSVTVTNGSMIMPPVSEDITPAPALKSRRTMASPAIVNMSSSSIPTGSSNNLNINTSTKSMIQNTSNKSIPVYTSENSSRSIAGSNSNINIKVGECYFHDYTLSIPSCHGNCVVKFDVLDDERKSCTYIYAFKQSKTLMFWGSNETVTLALKYIRYGGSSGNLRNTSPERKRGNIGLGGGLQPLSSSLLTNSKIAKKKWKHPSMVDIQELLNTDNISPGRNDTPIFHFHITSGIKSDWCLLYVYGYGNLFQNIFKNKELLSLYFNYKRLFLSLYHDRIIIHTNKSELVPFLVIPLVDIALIETELGSIQYAYKICPNLIANRMTIADNYNIMISTTSNDKFYIRCISARERRLWLYELNKAHEAAMTKLQQELLAKQLLNQTPVSPTLRRITTFLSPMRKSLSFKANSPIYPMDKKTVDTSTGNTANRLSTFSSSTCTTSGIQSESDEIESSISSRVSTS